MKWLLSSPYEDWGGESANAAFKAHLSHIVILLNERIDNAPAGQKLAAIEKALAEMKQEAK